MPNTNILDCGDNSCLFAKVRGGMRTNGGCRCLVSVPKELAQKIKRRFCEIQNDTVDCLGMKRSDILDICEAAIRANEDWVENNILDNIADKARNIIKTLQILHGGKP